MRDISISCTGNTDRSPLAEIWINYEAKDIRVWGSRASDGKSSGRISDGARKHLLHIGLPPDGIKRQVLPPPQRFDIYIAVDSTGSQSNLRAVTARLEPGTPVLHWIVDDPYGGGSSEFSRAFRAIMRHAARDLGVEMRRVV